ncbi:Hypothetical_protein [Hexamita inflata]|uniref:Hypothetical_protein n=1 Tax=Hexamita inflata TaxID=28002 RepID=A0ABP1GG23_9EUKA
MFTFILCTKFEIIHHIGQYFIAGFRCPWSQSARSAHRTPSMPSPNERPRIVLRELIWVPQELEYLVVSITIVMMYFGILCIAACLDGNGPLSLSVQRSSHRCTHEFCRRRHQFHCSVQWWALEMLF